MNIDESSVPGVPVAPHLLQEDFPGVDLPGFARQRDEQVELQRGQRDLMARASHRVPGDVDREIPDLESLRLPVVTAAQPGADPGDQLGRFEGFDHIVISAGLQTHHDVHRVGPSGKHDDGHPGLRPDPLADLDAIHPRKHDVEQDQVGPVIAEGRQGRGPIGPMHHVQALTA